jgi:hypothetical protein
MTRLDPIEEATRAAYDDQAKIWTAEHDDPDYWADEFRDFQRLLPLDSSPLVDYHFSVRSERTRWHCFFVQV